MCVCCIFNPCFECGPCTLACVQLVHSLAGGLSVQFLSQPWWCSGVHRDMSACVGSELFYTVIDMLSVLVHGTLISDGQEKLEDNKKVYHNLIKKLKVWELSNFSLYPWGDTSAVACTDKQLPGVPLHLELEKWSKHCNLNESQVDLTVSVKEKSWQVKGHEGVLTSVIVAHNPNKGFSPI